MAEHLATVGKVTDAEILIAALLHDVIEDWPRNDDEYAVAVNEIRDGFGERVLSLVLECSDDKKRTFFYSSLALFFENAEESRSAS